MTTKRLLEWRLKSQMSLYFCTFCVFLTLFFYVVFIVAFPFHHTPSATHFSLHPFWSLFSILMTLLFHIIGIWTGPRSGHSYVSRGMCDTDRKLRSLLCFRLVQNILLWLNLLKRWWLCLCSEPGMWPGRDWTIKVDEILNNHPTKAADVSLNSVCQLLDSIQADGISIRCNLMCFTKIKLHDCRLLVQTVLPLQWGRKSTSKSTGLQR